jgi:hypothetical protein
MRETRPYGSVRGAAGNGGPYRDRAKTSTADLRLPTSASLASAAQAFSRELSLSKATAIQLDLTRS